MQMVRIPVSVVFASDGRSLSHQPRSPGCPAGDSTQAASPSGKATQPQHRRLRCACRLWGQGRGRPSASSAKPGAWKVTLASRSVSRQNESPRLKQTRCGDVHIYGSNTSESEPTHFGDSQNEEEGLMAELCVWGVAVSAMTLLAEFLLGGQGAGGW